MTLGNLEPHCGENCCYTKGTSEVGNRTKRRMKAARQVKMWGYAAPVLILDLSEVM